MCIRVCTCIRLYIHVCVQVYMCPILETFSYYIHKTVPETNHILD